MTTSKWVLVHADSSTPVVLGDKARDFRGNEHVIVGGTPPHKPESTGRVYTADNRECFPSVFDMRWIQQ
jgi:hypothetical protein